MNQLENKSICLISNACGDLYPENSLVDFKNRLPFVIEIGRNEGIEIALSYLGISNNFKNIPVPAKNLPSFFITDCVETAHEMNNLGEVVQLPVHFKFKDSEDASTIPFKKCKWHQYNFEDKFYSLTDFEDFFKKVSEETNTNIKFADNKLFVQGHKGHKFWIIMHKKMINYFNFKNFDPITHIEITDDDPSIEVCNVETADGMLFVLRKVFYKDQLYYAYQVRGRATIKERDYFLESAESNILKKRYPSVIKVTCDNLTPQVFNSTFSKDLIVFSPNFEEEADYSCIEFSSKQYIPISNTNISEFSIKLVDQDNELIPLLPGIATMLKVDLRLRRAEKKSFNIRLTSASNSEYPDNTNSIFKVKLPGPISVNRNWRVALSSISNPNTFATFLSDPDTRGFLIRELMPPTFIGKTIKLIIPDDRKVYTNQELVDYIDKNLKEVHIGSARLEDGKCIFTFNNDVMIIMANPLLHMLGGTYFSTKKFTRLIYTKSRAGEHDLIRGDYYFISGKDRPYNVGFQNIMNLNFLRPSYILVYANIVTKSIIGGTMSNILRVVPVKSNSDERYAITDFKHKDYYTLQNTEIDSIEINLRSHDGLPINFASFQDTIVNLEFSNYLDAPS